MAVTTCETLEQISQEGYTVLLVAITPAGEDTRYEVQCTYGRDHETEEFDDFAKAHAGYRTVVRQAFGINVPYKAPVAVMPPSAPEDPYSIGAVDLMFMYHGRIKQAGPGSAAMSQTLEEMGRDPLVHKFAGEILENMTAQAGWVVGSMRQILRDLIKAQREAETAEIQALPNFGRF
jgi:hypothetical protein